MARDISDQDKADAVGRVRAGESKASVARSLGVTGPTITNWLAAADNPTDETPDPATPPVDLAPIPPGPAPRAGDPGDACGLCRPPQGIDSRATSFTCAHGHWIF